MGSWPYELGQYIIMVEVCGRGGSYLMVYRKQRKEQEEARDMIPSIHAPIDLLPQVRNHLLKFPEPSKITPQLGDLGFKT
jgi:hypothetical protein